jgi:hypothetical protein
VALVGSQLILVRSTHRRRSRRIQGAGIDVGGAKRGPTGLP